ncbi:hypothetical protein OUZ56_033817 [Daphnia magna]|uniref:Uncharacterized protein n=1 Tax=Daphnia magna TaxID=35525 RepID=A0ABR0BB47_9CRUS|nr:hypothetical protein OUZ56_033817 [Daphnia magna]
MDFDLEKLPIEQTLGVMWNGETDMLTFKIRKQPSHDVLTKRKFLNIWTYEKRIGWDDPIPEE